MRNVLALMPLTAVASASAADQSAAVAPPAAGKPQSGGTTVNSHSPHATDVAIGNAGASRVVAPLPGRDKPPGKP